MADLKSDIKAAFAADPLAHLKRWFPEGKREAGRFRIGDAFGTKGRSLSIELKGDNAGMAFDHGTGETFGDVFDLYATVNNYPKRGPAFKEMLAAMAGEMGVDDRPNGKAKRKPNGQWHITGEWTYYDDDGQPWCVVKRHDYENGGKEYRQYSPKNMPGRPKYDGKFPLYNLYDTKGARYVLVVEGEKCVDVATKLEICATTSIGGQGQAKHSDWSALDDKHVIIWPDVGAESYAATVAELCGGAASIHIVEPRPDAPKGWDIADAVAEGLDVEPFLNDAKPFEISEEIWPNVLWIEDLEGKQPPTREFIINEWLPKGHVTSLYGKGGAGKSLIALQMASCIAAGEPFFGCPVDSGPVLAVFAEDTKDELHRRQQDICKRLVVTPKKVKMCAICHGMRPEENPDFRMISFSMDGKPDNEWQMSLDIDFLCDKIKPKLLLLDNIAQLFGGNENDRSQVTYWLNRLGALAQKYDMAILLLGHFNKNGNTFSGSTAWEAGVRSLWQFDRIGDDEGAPVKLEISKSNYTARRGMYLKWDAGSFKLAAQLTEEELREREEKEATAKGAALHAIDFLNERHIASSYKDRAKNRLDKLMEKFPDDNGDLLIGDLSPHAIIRALDELISEKIVLVDQEIGRTENRKPILSLARCDGVSE